MNWTRPLPALVTLGLTSCVLTQQDKPSNDTSDEGSESDRDTDSDTDIDTDVDVDTGWEPAAAYYCYYEWKTTGAPANKDFCPDCAFAFDVSYTATMSEWIEVPATSCSAPTYTTRTYGYITDYYGYGPLLMVDYYGSGYAVAYAELIGADTLRYFYTPYVDYPYSGYYYTYARDAQANIASGAWSGWEVSETSMWPTPNY